MGRHFLKSVTQALKTFALNICLELLRYCLVVKNQTKLLKLVQKIKKTAYIRCLIEKV